MKKLFESWRKFVNEKKFEDYDVDKGKWVDIPTSDLHHRDPEDKDLSDEFFDMIDKSYAPIGGHIDFNSPQDLPADHTDWNAVDVDADPEPDAVKIAKHGPGGLKSTGGASDGTPEGKKAYIERSAKALKTPGNYGELSGGIAHMMIKYHNVPYVDNPQDVQRLLKGKDIEWVGAHPEGKYPGYDGWYRRKLGGHMHMKIMLGMPKGASYKTPS